MAGFIHCVKFRTPTGFVTSGGGAADASFPHSYAADIAHPHRPWKSASNVSNGVTYYGVDFGSAVTLAAIAVDNLNIISIDIQAASDSAFSTSTITAAYGVSPNPVEGSLFTNSSGLPIGRLKAFIDLTGTSFDSASRRYWRIVAATSTPTNGVAAPMFLGSVAWCQSLTTWSSGTSSYDELPLEATRLNDDFAGGGADPVILGNPYSAITLSAFPGDYSTMRTPMLELLRQGLGRPFLFYRNAGDSSEFYICRRAADVSVKTTSPNTIDVDSFVLRAVV